MRDGSLRKQRRRLYWEKNSKNSRTRSLADGSCPLLPQCCAWRLSYCRSPTCGLLTPDLGGRRHDGPLRELATQFESASGHKLVFRFGTTPNSSSSRRLAAHSTSASPPSM